MSIHLPLTQHRGKIRGMPEEWLTTQEAAELSGYHIITIRKLLNSGKLDGRKWGPVWQVSRKSLADYQKKMSSQGAKRGPKRKVDKKSAIDI